MNQRSPLFLATSALAAATGGGIVFLHSSVVDRGQASRGRPRAEARSRMIEKVKTRQAKPFDQPQEPLAFYWAKRSPTGEPLGIAALEEAAAEAERLPVHFTAGDAGSHATTAPLPSSSSTASASGTLAGAWQPLGPGNIGGR